MPSPPPATSSCHQAVAAAVEVRVGGVGEDPAGGHDQLGIGRGQPVGQLQVPAVRPGLVGRPLGGQQLERGQPYALQTGRRPDVAPVRRGERVRVGPPGLGSGRQLAKIDSPLPRLPKHVGDHREGRPGRPRRPTRTGRAAAGSALTLHGISSASSSSHEVSSSVNSPARSAAPRSRSTSSAVTSGAKKGRPVRVHTAPERIPGCAEPGPGRLEVATDQSHGPGAHVLLLAHHRPHALGPVRGERLLRMLEQSSLPRRGHRAHGRGQIDQPARVDREPAHHLQRGGRVLRAYTDPGQVRRLQHPVTDHIGQVQHARVANLGDRCRDSGWPGTAGPARSRPRPPGRTTISRSG